MQRFREWRESLKKTHGAAVAEADSKGNGNDSSNSSGRRASATASANAGRSAGAERESESEQSQRSRSGSQYAKRDSAAAAAAASASHQRQPSGSVSGGSDSLSSSPLTFAELERLRRERHSIFVSILRDADSFAAFLRFLPAAQQQELLFVCEVNQLLERQQLPQPMDEADACMQAIKIANIFLRSADPTATRADSAAPAAGGSVLQVASIQPATRRHLQLCIPLSVPAHLQPVTGGSVSAAAGSAAGSTAAPGSGSGTGSGGPESVSDSPSSRYDSKMVLTLLEVARDQVEESISKKSLQRFLDLTAHGGDASRDGAAAHAHDEELSALHSDYTFDDCVPPAANIHRQRALLLAAGGPAADAGAEESGGLAYVFRSFLLFLMPDRHRILVSWAEVHRALALLKGTELDPDAGAPAAERDENGQVMESSQIGDAPSAAQPPPPPLKLSELHAIYTALEDAYRAFYPDYHLRPPTPLMLTLADPSLCSSPPPPHRPAGPPGLDAASHILSPTSPFASNDPDSPSRRSLDADLVSALDAAATNAEIAELRAAAADLAQKLRPMRIKMDKILRYTFWPQFCKSEQFHKLSSIKRPVRIATLPALATRTPSDQQSAGRRSRKGSRELAQADNKQEQPAAATVPSAAVKLSHRVKHALVSSLKQQKVTREMLVLECAGWEQVAARHQGRMRDGLQLVPPFPPPTSEPAAHASLEGAAERQRLLEYVCVMKSTPMLPARPSVVQQRLARAAAVTTASAAAQSARAHTAAHPRASAQITAPPLPPRPSAGAKLQSPPPAAAPAAAAPAGSVLRGNQSLSLFYRYPSVDHSSSCLPAHLVDLAFPLLPDAGNQENVCLCSKAASSVQLLHHSSRTRADDADDADDPTATAAAALHSQTHDSSDDDVPHTNRLYNLICTQADGTLLYGCVLQVTQSELVEERWEEIEPPEGDADSAALRASAAIGALRPSASAEVVAKATPSLAATAVSGVGANFLAAHSAGLSVSLSPVPPSVPPTNGSAARDTATDAASPRSAASKLSQMLDGFAKDIALLVDKVQNSSSNSSSIAGADAAPTAAVDRDRVPGGSTDPDASPSLEATPGAAAADAASQAAATPPVPSPSPFPSPSPPSLLAVPAASAASSAARVSGGSPGLSSVTAAAQLGSGVSRSSALSSFYSSPPTVSPAATSPIDGSAEIGGLGGKSRSLSGGGLSLLSSPPLGGRRKEPLIHRHHRVLRVQNQYAVVLLTRHPLFNLLRTALAHLLKQSDSDDAARGVEPVDDHTRSVLRSSFPSSLQGRLLSLFDSGAFYRLLCYTHPPRHSIDLFGISAHLYAPSYLLTPCVDFRFDVLFRCLHPRRLLLVLECLVTERKVVLLSNQNSLLTLACECLLALLYPFAWKYLYIPLLPYSLFKYLQCPTPFLMGVHACYRRKARELTDRDVVFVDLDHDEVTMPTMAGPRERPAAGGTTAAAAAAAGLATAGVPVSVDTPFGAASAADVTDPQAAFHLPFQVREQLLSVCHQLFAPEIEQLETGGGILTEREALLETADDEDNRQAGGESPLHLADSIIAPSLILPARPGVDEESGRLMDMYAGAESPADTRAVGRNSRAGSAAAPPASSAFSSTSTSPLGPSPSSARSVLLQLELLKVWSHLLKHYRNFVIHLSPASAADMPILIFDTPAFLATKPAHYVPFLTTLTNSSYFPLFLDERSCPLGIMPVQRDAFDRYEAAISGTRIHVWMDAFAFKRKAQQRAVTESGPEQHSNSNSHRHSSLTGQWVDGSSAPPSCLSSPTSSAVPFSSSRRLSLSSWLSSYQRSGIDPSVHHAKYLAGWNQHSNLRWTDIERLPRRWFDHDTHQQQWQQQQQQQQQEHQQLTNTTIAADGASTGGANGRNHSAMSDAAPPSAPVTVAPASVAPISAVPAAAALPIVSADAATPAASALAPPPSLSVQAPSSAPKAKSRLHRTMRRPSRSSTSASASAASSRSGSLSRDGAGSQPPSRPQSPHTDVHEQQAAASCPAATVSTEGEANDA